MTLRRSPAAAAACLALALLISLAAAPAALACDGHAPGEPCAAEQPGEEYKAFMAQQRQDVLADFAARAAARRAAEHQHYGSSAAGRRLLSPTQPRPQLLAASQPESQSQWHSLRWSKAAKWYKMWRTRLATEQIPKAFDDAATEGTSSSGFPQTADIMATTGMTVSADLMAASVAPKVSRPFAVFFGTFFVLLITPKWTIFSLYYHTDS